MVFDLNMRRGSVPDFLNESRQIRLFKYKKQFLEFI